jgi:hydrogenase maturation protein HypF
VLAAALARSVSRAATAVGALAVVVGGGCFHNRLLSERVAALLLRSALDVHRPQGIDCGDAGLALGQAWFAAHQLGRDRRAATAGGVGSRPCA